MQKSLTFLALTFFATLACAGDGNLLLRGRLINVGPNEDSSTILNTGTEVAVDDAFVPELDLTYFFNKHWALEIIAATSPHDLSGKDGGLNGADAGEVWVLPPTLTLQYHLGKNAPIDFYMGLGVNYSLFYNYDVSDDLQGLGVNDIDFDNSFGVAANIGVDFQIRGNWVLNLDLKYIDMTTDADLKLAAGGILDSIEVEIDPFVAGIGVGYRF